MQFALLTLLIPLVAATVSLEEIACGINKARADKKLPALYTSPTLTRVTQTCADGHVPNFPAQKALDTLKKDKYTVKTIGAAMVSGCTTSAACIKAFINTHSNYLFGKYNAIGIVKSGKWYAAALVDAKGADLQPGKCGLDNPDKPNKAEVEGGQIGKVDPKILLCLINKERAKAKLPALGYTDAMNKVTAQYLKNNKVDVFGALEKENVDDASTMTMISGMGCTSEKECLDIWINSNSKTSYLKEDTNIAGFATTEDKSKIILLFVGAESQKAEPPTGC